MNRVGIYLRVSTEEQARIVEGSLVSQRQRLEEYVAGQNRREADWGMLIDIYCDEAKSGKDMNRPEFQRLLDDVRTGRINLILATQLSRLSRSIRDFCELWDLFKAHNTRFITLREQFDTTRFSKPGICVKRVSSSLKKEFSHTTGITLTFLTKVDA